MAERGEERCEQKLARSEGAAMDSEPSVRVRVWSRRHLDAATSVLYPEEDAMGPVIRKTDSGGGTVGDRVLTAPPTVCTETRVRSHN